MDSSKQEGNDENSLLDGVKNVCSWLKKCSIVIEVDEKDGKIIEHKNSQLKGILRKEKDSSDHAIDKVKKEDGDYIEMPQNAIKTGIRESYR